MWMAVSKYSPGPQTRNHCRILGPLITAVLESVIKCDELLLELNPWEHDLMLWILSQSPTYIPKKQNQACASSLRSLIPSPLALQARVAMNATTGEHPSSPQGAPAYVAFDVLQATALFLSLVTLIPAVISPKIRRMRTWFALMISAVVYCSSFLVLIGRQAGPEPPFGLCVYQAGLIYAAPPTMAAAALTFVIELHWRLFSALTNIELKQARVTVLLFIPPMVHLVIFFLSLFNGLAHRGDVRRVPAGNLYCQITNKVPTSVTGVTVVLLLVLMILVECYTISYLWHRRRSCRDLRVNGSDGHYPFQSFVRMVFYTLVGGLGIVMVDLLVNALPDDNAVLLNMLAIVPLSIAVLFGSQMDIINFYLRRKPKWSPPPSKEVQASPKAQLGEGSRESP
ncbi:hypothetical protein PM082_019299 [Marasmius tenuissimus]|nr:hypothetical protein PM082_019299 [Marasmius tenuissimus]